MQDYLPDEITDGKNVDDNATHSAESDAHRTNVFTKRETHRFPVLLQGLFRKNDLNLASHSAVRRISQLT